MPSPFSVRRCIEHDVKAEEVALHQAHCSLSRIPLAVVKKLSRRHVEAVEDTATLVSCKSGGLVEAQPSDLPRDRHT
jgi:hypothetical protein